jgi:hypothetical protein
MKVEHHAAVIVGLFKEEAHAGAGRVQAGDR